MRISRETTIQEIAKYALLFVFTGCQISVKAQMPAPSDAKSTTNMIGMSGQPTYDPGVAAKVDVTRQAILNMFTNEIGTVALKVNVLTALNDDGNPGYIVVLSGQISKSEILDQLGSDPKTTGGALGALAKKINAAYNKKENASATKGQSREMIVSLYGSIVKAFRRNRTIRHPHKSVPISPPKCEPL